LETVRRKGGPKKGRGESKEVAIGGGGSRRNGRGGEKKEGLTGLILQKSLSWGRFMFLLSRRGPSKWGGGKLWPGEVNFEEKKLAKEKKLD